MRNHAIYVIGGGIIGLLTARELAAAGRTVIVAEREGVGRAASWAGGGILSPLHPWRYAEAVTALVSESQRVYPGLCRALTVATGIDPEWNPCGLLRAGADETALAMAWASRIGVALSAQAIEDLSAARGLALTGPSLWMPEVAQVRSPRLLQALAADVRHRGVILYEQAPVEALSWRQGRITGLRIGGEECAATMVVVAAGAWSGQFLARYGLTLPVAPVQGQMIALATPVDTLTTMVLQGTRYLIPRRDGLILVGSTLEEVGFERAVTVAARDELMACAQAIMPGLADWPVVHHWAGLRPASPAGIPFIGEHPELRGLYVNTGHFRNGIVLAPASARLLADLMLGRSPWLAPELYALDRPTEPEALPSVV
ncbi:MAG: glycine oxidase ThiO [Acidiferrobacter sp.]